MAIYLLNFISIPIYDLLIKNKKRLVFLVATQIFLILALRADTLGVDLENYKQYYEFYRTLPFGEILRGFRLIGGSAHDFGVESGYVLFNWLIGQTGASFHTFLVIYAAIVVGSVSLFIYRYCENPALGFATFISLGAFISFFGILRQSLGLAILLFAIPSLVKRKFWRYLFFVALAGLFHQSLFIAILLYFFSKLKANRPLYASVIISSVLIPFLTPIIYNKLISPLLEKLGRPYSISDFSWNNMFAIMIALALVFMLFFNNSEREDNSLQCAFLMALPLQALAFHIPIFSRLANAVFLNFSCTILPNMLCRIDGKSQRFQANTVAYLGLFAFYAYTMIDSVLVPYVPFWAS